MLTSEIQALINQFPFHRVYKTMRVLDWQWTGGTPGISEMIRTVEDLFETLLENDSVEVSTGGFTVYKCAGLEDGLTYGIRFVAAELDTECVEP